MMALLWMWLGAFATLLMLLRGHCKHEARLQALEQRVFRLDLIHDGETAVPSKLALEDGEEFCDRCLGVGRVSYGGPLTPPCPRCFGSGRRRKK